MTTRTMTAMFNTRPEAESAAEQLVSQLGVDRAAVRTSPDAGATDAGYDKARPYQETGFFASIKNLFLSEEDRYGYAEGMRCGGVLVSAEVDLSQLDRAADILEDAGAVDLDQQEEDWRQGGWTDYDATAAAVARPAPTRPAAATAAGAGRDEVIAVAEERLVLGKREVERGRVRVRSYVVERPAEAQVRLHEERVQMERHPVGRPLTEADRVAAFQDRTLEATARSEEAVVGKEARVVEEIAVRKEAADRVETVRDTVRRTEVEVDDGSARTAGAAVDKTVGTSIGSADPRRK